MRRKGGISLLLFWTLALAGFALAAQGLEAQTDTAHLPFARRHSLGVFVEYSPTSSPMLLGISRQRKLVGVGGAFTRRLLSRHSVELEYLIEVRPLLMESDPTVVSFYSNQFGYVKFLPPVPVVNPNNLADFYNVETAQYAYGGYSDAIFSRRWTYTGGADPFGFKTNGFKRDRVQPEAMANAGLIVAMRDIPIQQSSYFNFTFQFGVGVQWYRTTTQSLLLEYRFQHFSSKDLGTYNPGTDSGVVKLTYWFGKD